ncbi:MAG: alpha/beta hydrolase, partial [Gammaproteobacteria bacterium]|nr:alpha/beta hydrolase [Gammaproteobacteria bacterium]
LLFISGTGADLRNRPNVFDGPLAVEFEVLSYDQRGLGQTDKPALEYSMADYADDAAALLDVMNWQCEAVVGVSFGGMVAQELALRHPDKVRALVLACTSAGGQGGASYPLHDLADLDPEIRVARQLVLADTRRTPQWQAANPERWAELVEMAGRAQRSDGDPGGAARQLRARVGHDTWDRLGQLELPVLLAGGEHDGIAPPVNMAGIHARIVGSQLTMFSGGHLFLVQDKTAYPYVIQWLKDNLE